MGGRQGLSKRYTEAGNLWIFVRSDGVSELAALTPGLLDGDISSEWGQRMSPRRDGTICRTDEKREQCQPADGGVAG